MASSKKTKSSESLSSLNSELEQSHSELLQIFELSSIGMAMVSPNGKWINANKHLSEILGYSVKELLSMNFNDITHPEDQAIGTDKIREVLEGKIEQFEIEKRYFHKSGRIIHVAINSSLIRHLDGSPKYFISQTKDITAFKNSLEALRVSEEKLRLLFENAPVGITHFDSNGNITMANQTIADMLGSSVEKILAINTRTNIANNKQREAFEAALNGKIGHFEGEYTSITGGKTSYLKAIYAPLFDKEKKVGGGIGITENITEGKLQEKKLIQSLHEKELLLKEVYHRVKNNLQTIISLINIQINEASNEELIDGMQEIKNRLFAMAKVHEVLCKSETFVSISLTSYITDLLDNLLHPQVKYNLNIATEVTLNVDQTNSLGIIINELITNSIKHNLGHDVIISLNFELMEENKMRLNYLDNGIGITNSKGLISSSLGMNLISLLAEDQLDGRLTLLDDTGFHILLEFEVQH
ncbi:MAG: PAS domain S-box protein [Bacteroidia bacterium]|nr:PAS domain S-box protein [Bacteroidia bacterium]